MPENALSLIITVGLFALTAAWVPCLETLQRFVRRWNEAAPSARTHTEVEAFWTEPTIASLTETTDKQTA